MGQAVQPGQADHFLDSLGAIGVFGQAVGDVLFYRQVREERAFLKYHAHPALFRGDAPARLVNRLAADADGTGFGVGEPGNQAEGGGLAATAGAEQGDDLTLGDSQVESINGDGVSEALGNTHTFQHCFD